jgi:hypothetical protein
MQLHPTPASGNDASLCLPHQHPGKPSAPPLLRYIQRHHIPPPPRRDTLHMNNYKPHHHATALLRNNDNRTALLSKSSHRLPIKTKLRREASNIQPKHRLDINSPIITKRNFTTHAAPDTLHHEAEPILAQCCFQRLERSTFPASREKCKTVPIHCRLIGQG